MAEGEYLEIEARTGSQALAERAMAEAWEAGAAGIEERDSGRLIVYVPAGQCQAVQAALAELVREGLELAPARPVEEIDWSERWKQGLKALQVSGRLVIRPSFVSHRLLPGQRELVIDPGQAFGTGGHASTWLALEWIDRLLEGETTRARGLRVLDVGTGTGVLAMAALQLGAASGIGFDLDPVAVREAKLWAARNGIGSQLGLFAGPLAALAVGEFDLVVANLLRREILPIAGDVAERVAIDGWLVLSGLLESDRAPVAAAFAGHGLAVVDSGALHDAAGDDWISLLLRRGAR